MNKPSAIEQQVQVMVDALAEARGEVHGRSNIGLHFIIEKFRPPPHLFWRVVDRITDLR